MASLPIAVAPATFRLSRVELASLAIGGGFCLCIVIGVAVLPLRYDGSDLNAAFLVLSLFWLLGWWLGRGPAAAVGAALRALAVLLALGFLAALASVVLAHTALPFADRQLALIDAVLVPGWDWARIAPAMAGMDGRLLGGLSRAYVSLTWQPPALVVLLALRGRTEAMARFMLAWALALAASIAIFPLVPARAVHLTYGLDRGAMPGVRVDAAWDHIRLLDAARNWRLETLSIETLNGIVTFPSFHIAGAVLLAWGFRQVGRTAFVPALALNLAMIVSAFPIGGHYIVDGVAGVAVAWAALAVSRRIAAVDRAAA